MIRVSSLDTFSRVLTFDSAAAVGLIVVDEYDEGKEHQGAFLTPEQARQVAADLLEFADMAQANRDASANLTDDEREKILRAMGMDE